MSVVESIRIALVVVAAMLVSFLGGGPLAHHASAEESPKPKNSASLAKQLYARVMEEYQQGHYQEALAGFQFFLALYPKSALALNAQFWVGDCQYRLGHYQEAINSFSRVSDSENSPKKAGATLKMGLAYRQLGNHDASRILLERVLLDFPDTPEAKVARRTIEQLGQPSPPQG